MVFSPRFDSFFKQILVHVTISSLNFLPIPFQLKRSVSILAIIVNVSHRTYMFLLFIAYHYFVIFLHCVIF